MIGADGDKRPEELRPDGVTSEESLEFLAVQRKTDETKKRLVKARAQLTFALDQMTEEERREHEAFHAEVRAETHGTLADDRRQGDARGSEPGSCPVDQCLGQDIGSTPWDRSTCTRPRLTCRDCSGAFVVARRL